MRRPLPASIRRGKLSSDEECEIITLAERRLTPGQIARRINRHPGTVNFAMHRLGARTLAEREFEYERNGVTVHSFSREEDAWITALRIQGYSITKIAELGTKRFGHPRTPATISMRLTMLANREDES